MTACCTNMLVGLAGAGLKPTRPVARPSRGWRKSDHPAERVLRDHAACVVLAGWHSAWATSLERKLCRLLCGNFDNMLGHSLRVSQLQLCFPATAVFLRRGACSWHALPGDHADSGLPFRCCGQFTSSGPCCNTSSTATFFPLSPRWLRDGYDPFQCGSLGDGGK